jgi:hypothetical protein
VICENPPHENCPSSTWGSIRLEPCKGYKFDSSTFHPSTVHSFPLGNLIPGHFVREFVSWNQMSQILISFMRLHHFHLSFSRPAKRTLTASTFSKFVEMALVNKKGPLSSFRPFCSSGHVEYPHIILIRTYSMTRFTSASITTVRRVATAKQSKTYYTNQVS